MSLEDKIHSKGHGDEFSKAYDRFVSSRKTRNQQNEFYDELCRWEQRRRKPTSSSTWLWRIDMAVTNTNGAVCFTGEDVPSFQIITIRRAIMLYRDTGIKANRAYTPTAMKRTAENLTGLTFNRGDWTAMAAALEALLPAGTCKPDRHA